MYRCDPPIQHIQLRTYVSAKKVAGDDPVPLAKAELAEPTHLVDVVLGRSCTRSEAQRGPWGRSATVSEWQMDWQNDYL